MSKLRSESLGRKYRRCKKKLMSGATEGRSVLEWLDKGSYDVICVFENRKLSFVSSAVLQMYGYSPEEFALLPPFELVHPEDKDQLQVRISADLQQKLGQSAYLFREQRKDGQYMWVEAGVNRFFAPDGSVTAIYNLRDITARMEAHLAQKQTREQAEKNMRAKDAFFSMMSHEIRTPLNGVVGLSNILSEPEARHDRQRLAQSLKYSADHLLRIVNEILDFSKIQSGHLSFEIVPFSLQEVLAALYDTCSNQAHEKGLSFELKTDPQVPDRLLGDPTRLLQILQNLTCNAVKFTEKGGIFIHVYPKALLGQKASITFSVRDTGIGIAPEYLETVFQPFQQAGKHIYREHGGTGLGLAIVRHLTELQGGEISVASQPGHETIFELWIPYQVQSELIKEVPTVQPAEGAKKVSSLRVLCAEDSEINRIVLENLLFKQGVKAHFVENGEQAVKAAAVTRFDLLLMDLHMPIMDGYQAARLIRSGGASQHTHIVALTAESSGQIAQQVEQAGMNGLLIKPLKPATMSELITSIESTLAKTTHKNTSDMNNQQPQPHNMQEEDSPFKTSSPHFALVEQLFAGNDGKLRSFLSIFMKEYTKYGTQLTHALRTQDAEGFRKILHKLRPGLMTLRCHELLDLLDQIAEHTWSHETTSFREKANYLLEMEWNHLTRSVQTKIDTLPAPPEK